MDKKDKELLTLQFDRMEEMIKDISEDVKETKDDVKETKKDVKNVEVRVRDIEEIVRAKDVSDKLISARVEALERKTSITGFFVDHPKIFWSIVVIIFCLVFYNNKEVFNLIKMLW